jgi:hypothetical protein
MTLFWKLNIYGTLAYLAYSAFKPKASPSPAPLPARPAAPPPSAKLGPFARPVAANPTLNRPVVTAPLTYQWVRSQADGQIQSPNEGDDVWAMAQDTTGARWNILLQAIAIDEVGNFTGTVLNNAGFSLIANNVTLTVPLAAISWITPQGTT